MIFIKRCDEVDVMIGSNDSGPIDDRGGDRTIVMRCRPIDRCDEIGRRKQIERSEMMRTAGEMRARQAGQADSSNEPVVRSRCDAVERCDSGGRTIWQKQAHRTI